MLKKFIFSLNIVTSNSKDMKAPKKGVYPKHINNDSKVKGLWSKLMNKYKDVITRSSDIEKQWQVAITIFKKACDRLGYIPFDTSDIKREKQERKKLIKNLYSRSQKLNKKLDSYCDSLEITGYSDTWTDSIYIETDIKSGEYYIRIGKQSSYDEKEKDEIAELLQGWGFGYVNGDYVMKVDKDRLVVVFYQGKVYMYGDYLLSSDQAKLLTKREKKENILEVLDTMSESWVDTGKING